VLVVGFVSVMVLFLFLVLAFFVVAVVMVGVCQEFGLISCIFCSPDEDRRPKKHREENTDYKVLQHIFYTHTQLWQKDSLCHYVVTISLEIQPNYPLYYFS
jgi:hypothetical protein